MNHSRHVTTGKPPFTRALPRLVRVRIAQRDAETETKEPRQRPHSNTAQYAGARRVLEQAIQFAVGRSDYNTAAMLRRELQAINGEDPYFQLTQNLNQAVSDQDFFKAASIKKQLTELEPLLGISTRSETITRGVRVSAKSHYQESIPDGYFFSYQITISNESDRVVQLRNRYWMIKDRDGNTEEVRGPGVVGVQPILMPGRSFSYDSGCPLPTSSGSMEGSYEMFLLSEHDGLFTESFHAPIGCFKLSICDA